MPKVTKLHVKAKGKPTSLQKPCKVTSEDTEDAEQSISQFQLELCWCIQQLERTLSEKKGNEKQLQEAWKVLTILKNNNQPMIRKRQLMRTHFGDYRAKMAAEEKKLVKMASKMKITDAPTKPKATFLRKSAFLTTGDNSFRFNFNVPTESESQKAETSSKSSLDNDGNTKVTNSSGNTEGHINENSANTVSSSNNLDKFKFKFSRSEFKFNFNVNSNTNE